VGKLVVNAGKDSQAPPYRVLDYQGKVVGEVTPAAGVDLRAYCNRTVTLLGTMAGAPQGAPPHLLAMRVVGADLWFNPSVMGQAGRQESQPPIRPTAYQEPSTEIVPSGNPQSKQDKTPGAGQRSLLSSPIQDSGPALPSAPLPIPGSPPVPASPPISASPPMSGPAPMSALPSVSASPPMSGPAPMSALPSVSASPPTPPSPFVPEPGAFPVTVQSEQSVNADGPACGGCDFCCPRRGRLWGEVDYLVWWTSGMSVPALVTQGSVADEHPGALGQSHTSVLFGDDSILTDGRSGGRVEIGYWFNDCHTSGIEVEYLGLDDDTDPFYIWKAGSPVIARPFYDTSTNEQRSEFVAFPYVPLSPHQPIAGSVSVDPRTDFQSAALRLRWEWFGQGSFCDPGDCSPCQYGRRVDVTLGYRYLQLNDQLDIDEALTSTSYVTTGYINPGTGTTNPLVQGSFRIQDSFRTYNAFQGGEMGLAFQSRQGRWSLDLAPKLALGSTRETVAINGVTIFTSSTGQATLLQPQGGLLAQKSNIGEYQRDVFSVIPQVNLKLGYQLTPCLRFTTGYDFLYWSRVVRAGDQIDPAVNASMLPGAPGPVTGRTAPTFAFHDTGFWAQGVSLGLEYGW
jgi:hypothetical protein